MEVFTLPIAVVLELVVAAESDDSAHAQSVREEDLSGCVDPDFAVRKLVESWYEQVFDTVPCTVERETFNQEYEEQDVGKETGEVDDL